MSLWPIVRLWIRSNSHVYAQTSLVCRGFFKTFVNLQRMAFYAEFTGAVHNGAQFDFVLILHTGFE